VPVPSPARADMIGINFHGGTYGSKIGAKVAGVEPQVNWNDVGWWPSADILDNTGATTAVSVITDTTEQTYNSYVNVDPPDGGNDYLMRGYIYPSGSPMTVKVSGLGPPFTVHGYSVIVYFDGKNCGTGTDWVTAYSLSTGKTIYGNDEAEPNGAKWDGQFAEASGTAAANATAGNYVRFTGLTTSGFLLTATPISGDGPINAIQIIAAPEPASASLLALGLATALVARVRRPKPGCSA